LQEEVTQKTIALSVNVGKGAARLTEQALQKAIKKFLEQRKSHTPHGKQTMRQLMKQNAGVSNIEITDSNIKAFESTAKKYNIDFSLKKVKGEQTRYFTNDGTNQWCNTDIFCLLLPICQRFFSKFATSSNVLFVRVFFYR